MLTVLAVGNPGSGKSTVLNALTGAQNFEAGVSFGSGLTSKLQEVVVNGIRYADTPGVADDTYRQALFLCNMVFQASIGIWRFAFYPRLDKCHRRSQIFPVPTKILPFPEFWYHLAHSFSQKTKLKK